ncbi:hypothetical protein C8R43DRAFT_955222 [Mycena crocata]|nr:hypothetical protein C8R43DRAFT_955222 [Mycena crocata]
MPGIRTTKEKYERSKRDSENDHLPVKKQVEQLTPAALGPMSQPEPEDILQFIPRQLNKSNSLPCYPSRAISLPRRHAHIHPYTRPLALTTSTPRTSCSSPVVEDVAIQKFEQIDQLEEASAQQKIDDLEARVCELEKEIQQRECQLREFTRQVLIYLHGGKPGLWTCVPLQRFCFYQRARTQMQNSTKNKACLRFAPAVGQKTGAIGQQQKDPPDSIVDPQKSEKPEGVAKVMRTWPQFVLAGIRVRSSGDNRAAPHIQMEIDSAQKGFGAAREEGLHRKEVDFICAEPKKIKNQRIKTVKIKRTNNDDHRLVTATDVKMGRSEHWDSTPVKIPYVGVCPNMLKSAHPKDSIFEHIWT